MHWWYTHHKNIYKKQAADSTATSFAIYHGTYVSNVHVKYYGSELYGTVGEVAHIRWTDGQMDGRMDGWTDGRTQPIA